MPRRPTRLEKTQSLATLVERKPHRSTQISTGRAIAQYLEAKEKGIIDDSPKLSKQEEEFALYVSEGQTLADAYRLSFPDECYTIDPKGDKTAILTIPQCNTRGYRLSRKGCVVKRMLELMNDSAAMKYHTAMRLQRLRRSVLEEIASSPTAKDSDRLRACQALGELSDLQAVQDDQALDLSPNDEPGKIIDAIFTLIETKATT